MSRSRRRSKPVSLFGALLIEVGTVVAIIAIAQPTWTSKLIEHVAPQSTTASPLPAPSTLRSNEVPASNFGAVDGRLGSGQLGTFDSLNRSVNSADHTVERVAQFVPPQRRFSIADRSGVPQISVVPLPAVYPPPMNLTYAPAWSGSY